MLKLEKVGHRELERYYPLLETDFDSEELLPRLAVHRGMMNGSIEFLVLRDEESRLDAGYALVLTRNLYGYVDLKYMGVMPWFRGKGLGIQLMRELNRRYADAQGILAEVSEFEDPDPDRLRKLRKFFSRFGYEEVPSNYRLGGTEVTLMVKPIQGTGEIATVAHRMIRDFYSRVLGPARLDKMVDIRRHE
jgi:GNAT superfamily N-acetyltransferase